MSYIETTTTTWVCDWCGDQQRSIDRPKRWNVHQERDFCNRDHCSAVGRWLETGERRCLPGQPREPIGE